ncbi:MAG: site-specific DNA-methyltransferase [Prevotella sp.]|nr:site-specific DNA-methyltransferase [Prevotella sp.]
MTKVTRASLRSKIESIEGLTNEERSALLNLINTKKYGLVWEDKPEEAEERLQDELPVLEEVKERALLSDNSAAPNHILIEGDNLHALTALSYTHAGKIDVIYIDPPYNTGNKDFIYNDKYVDSEDEFRHSKWLSFMSRRLKIAKKLLSEKGVMFISIDDNEQANLKLMCDEIFGENNFIANFIWKSKSGGANDASSVATDHEYLLLYANNKQNVSIFNDIYATVTTSYNREDEKGKYSLDRLDKQNLGYLESLDFPIEGPDGQIYVVEHKDPNNKKARWRWGKDTVNERYDELVFKFPYVYTKNYQKKGGQKPRTVLFDERFGRTRTGSTELKKIIGNQNIFSYPKPSVLLKFLLSISANKKYTILDFFAGSGTTLHATMQLNNEDGGRRQCILVTNNENNICEDVTYERNKRVINGYTTPKGEQVEGLHDNNLRYYKTNFVGRKHTNRNMRKLMEASTDMLCIKNDVYKKQDKFGGRKLNKNVVRFFDDGKTPMLIIYNELAVEKIVDVLITMQVERKIKVYVFSNSRYAYDDDFMEVADKVELCALPDAIYRAYVEVIGKQRPKQIIEDATANDETSKGRA